MKTLPPAAALVLLLGCGGEAEENNSVDLPLPSGPPVVQQIEPEAGPEAEAGPQSAPQAAAGWQMAASGGGLALRFLGSDGTARMTIACLGRRLSASAPSFTPIGSEDRFTLGLGQEPVTLVADPTRQTGGGVTGEAPVPDNFGRLLAEADQIVAVYGAQREGPHPAPPAALASRLAGACDEPSGG